MTLVTLLIGSIAARSAALLVRARRPVPVATERA